MDFRLEAFFLNKRLLLAIAGDSSRERIKRLSAQTGESPLAALLVDAGFADAAVQAIDDSAVRPLRWLLLHGDAKPGVLTWEEAAFYFQSQEAFRSFEKGDRSARGRFHTALDEFEVTLQGSFSPEHVIGAASAPGHLQGKQNRFVLGYIDSIADHVVDVRPLLIGRRLLTGDFAAPLARSLWVAPQRIHQFSKLDSVKPRDVDASVLEHIPERAIKDWFAEIIGEPYVEKDWGGEKSDLWTSRLTIDIG